MEVLKKAKVVRRIKNTALGLLKKLRCLLDNCVNLLGGHTICKSGAEGGGQAGEGNRVLSKEMELKARGPDEITRGGVWVEKREKLSSVFGGEESAKVARKGVPVGGKRAGENGAPETRQRPRNDS